MGLLDKVKNLFTEEVEVEVEEKAPIKKEVIQVEIPSPAKTTRSELHTYEDDIVTENKPKEEYKFPFFDDNDFDNLDVKVEEKKENKKSNYKKEVYNPPKEEKKIFKPSPIISPVYGILDKDYQKDKLKNKDENGSYYNPKEATVDEIRNKAYGTLEADIETTLFGSNRVLFDNENSPKETIEQSVKNEEEIANHLSDLNDEFNSETIGEKPRHSSNQEDDLTDLLEQELSKPETEEKKPRKISDDELFNIIDSMYEKGDKK